MKIKSISRADLEGMKDGEVRTFELQDARAIDSARATCTQMGRYLNRRFTCNADYRRNEVTISRLAPL